MSNVELLNSIVFYDFFSPSQPINLLNLISFNRPVNSVSLFFLPDYIQSPSCHWINFKGSGFQPQHLISRLKTAPTNLVLALSIYPISTRLSSSQAAFPISISPYPPLLCRAPCTECRAPACLSRTQIPEDREQISEDR
jgi:hypothetical protein